MVDAPRDVDYFGSKKALSTETAGKRGEGKEVKATDQPCTVYLPTMNG